MKQQLWKVAVVVVVVVLVVLVMVGGYREDRELRARLPRLRSKRSAEHPTTGEMTHAV